MQTFEKAQAVPDEGATVHVALLDDDGIVLIHEEIPAPEAPLRSQMLTLQAELDVRDIAGASRRVYAGADWPPEGHQEKRGKVTPLPPEDL